MNEGIIVDPFSKQLNISNAWDWLAGSKQDKFREFLVKPSTID